MPTTTPLTVKLSSLAVDVDVASPAHGDLFVQGGSGKWNNLAAGATGQYLLPAAGGGLAWTDTVTKAKTHSIGDGTVPVTIVRESTATTSKAGLDVYNKTSNQTDWHARFWCDGSYVGLPGTWQPRLQFGGTGSVETQGWLTVSGSFTGTGDTFRVTPPTNVPYMGGFYSDIIGPGLVARLNDSGTGHQFEAIDSTGASRFWIKNDGLYFGSTTTRDADNFPASDVSLVRDSAGVLAVAGTLAATTLSGRQLLATSADGSTVPAIVKYGVASPTVDALQVRDVSDAFLFRVASQSIGGKAAVTVGATTAVATATPGYLSLGGSYSSSGGANPKLRVYDDGTTAYGLGVSTSQMDYVGGTGTTHSFYCGTTRVAAISTAGLALSANTGGVGVGIASFGNTQTAAGPARVISLAGGTAADGSGGYVSMQDNASAERLRLAWMRRSGVWGLEILDTSNARQARIDTAGTLAVTTSVAVGSTTVAGSTTPNYLSLGGSYSSAAGANPKLRLYDDGTAALGLGISSSQIDYVGASGWSHAFYCGATKVGALSTSGLALSGPIGVNGASPPAKAASPGTATGTDAAVINAISLILRNAGFCS